MTAAPGVFFQPPGPGTMAPELEIMIAEKLSDPELVALRDTSKIGKARADLVLAKRHGAGAAAKIRYCKQTGQFPLASMPPAVVDAAKGLRGVKASTYKDFASQDPPVAKDEAAKLLLSIPLTEDDSPASIEVLGGQHCTLYYSYWEFDLRRADNHKMGPFSETKGHPGNTVELAEGEKLMTNGAIEFGSLKRPEDDGIERADKDHQSKQGKITRIDARRVLRKHAVAKSAFELGTWYANVEIRHVHFPLGLTKILDCAFENNTTLQCGLFFPETLEEICSWAFHGCTGITGTLKFPPSLKSIGASAFADCPGITRVEFAEHADVEINWLIFDRCDGLTIHIPASARLTFADHARLTFESATNVECTIEFFHAHRSQFGRHTIHVPLSEAAAAAAGTGAVFGRPHDYAMQQIN